MVVQLLVMSAALGASSFAVGMLPLSYAFSKSHLERLSVLGTGLLLGAALGVIVPEGIEAVARDTKYLPTGLISFYLIIGFVIMLIIEQLVAPNAHTHALDHEPIALVKSPDVHGPSAVEFDAELGDIDVTNRPSNRIAASKAGSVSTSEGRERAFALLLGLVIHGAADGLALGVANLAQSDSGASNTVSFIVFLALMLHKAPTSLAFTTSILSTSLPRWDCKKYVAIFSASTPTSAVASYFVFSIFGDGSKIDFIGPALLLSGGSFLYVATVLQPVSHHSPAPGDMKASSRVLFIALGMFIPLILRALFDHDH